MAHEIENAVRRADTDVSWHGLEGTISPEDARHLPTFLKAAGLDWTAEKHLLMSFNPETNESVPVNDYCAVRRSTDGALLGVHSGEYEVHNPADVLAPIHESVLADDRFNWNFATSLRGGKIITATADFLPEYEVAGDKHSAFLFASTSFDGTRATMMGGSTIRIVCMNTFRAAMQSSDTKKIRLKHRSSIEGRQVDLAQQIESTIRTWDAYKEIGEQLAQQRIDRGVATDLLSKLLFVPKEQKMTDKAGKEFTIITEPATRTQNRIDDLIRSFDTSVEERGGEVSQWAVWQAVTRFADHERGTRMTKGREARGETEEAVRFDSNLLGTSDAFKQEAFEKILQAA